MQNVLLVVHLIVALCLIAVVLLQRSEGGALGIGGGGGGGLVSSRGATTALTKLTWGLAIAFITTSITLTVVAGGREAGSVFDGLATEDGDIPLPTVPSTNDLLPGAADEPSGTAPTVPQPAD